ncbi:MAG: hypothetical protein MR713_09975 [Firmicutes bacterium]|nr:hypothetical protein [Bacillota bacterium]
MKFTIGTVNSDCSFKETLELIKSSLLYADEIELIGMAEYAIFSYLPNHINKANDLEQLLNALALILKSVGGNDIHDTLDQIEALSDQIKVYNPILKKKKHRSKQEIIAQMKIKQTFNQGQAIIKEGLEKIIDTEGAREIKSLTARKIITVHDYDYDQFSTDELAGGYFGNLLNAMRNNTAFPLFDRVSEDVIKNVANTHLLDFGNANPEILRHAGIASNIIMTLPTLNGASVDEILCFKEDNKDSLIGFRKAIFEFSEKINSMPWDDDFKYDCLKLYSTQVAPRVRELNELASEASVVRNLGKQAIEDAEIRKAAGFAIGGIASTVLCQAGLMDAFVVLRDILISASLLTVSTQVASGFMKSISLLNKSKDFVSERTKEMQGNTMYYYYKASKKI